MCRCVNCVPYNSIDVLVGAVVIYDKLKPEARGAVKGLQSMGIKVALLTGDNRRTALAIAEAVSTCTCTYKFSVGVYTKHKHGCQTLPNGTHTCTTVCLHSSI